MTPPLPVTCASTVVALCAAACRCGGSDTARACALGNVVDGAGGGALGWSGAAACELYFASSCMDGAAGPGFAFTACNGAVSSAACVATVDGPALAFPMACAVAAPDGSADARGSSDAARD